MAVLQAYAAVKLAQWRALYNFRSCRPIRRVPDDCRIVRGGLSDGVNYSDQTNKFVD